MAQAFLTSLTAKAHARFMDVSAILMRRAHLHSQAAVVCAHARNLCAEARIQLQVSVHWKSASRTARLARGGSNGGPVVPKASDGLKVVHQPVCPRCGKGAIAPDGSVTVANGLVKTTYRCDACEQSFVSVRQALD